jgi:ribonuclease HIII
MGFYLVQPCKSTAAFEAIPQKKVKLDFKIIEPKLNSHGFETMVNARVVLVVSKNNIEISIYPTGKLLLKVDDKANAQNMVMELEPILF